MSKDREDILKTLREQWVGLKALAASCKRANLPGGDRIEGAAQELDAVHRSMDRKSRSIETALKSEEGT